jgi:hypothetical protein
MKRGFMKNLNLFVLSLFLWSVIPFMVEAQVTGGFIDLDEEIESELQRIYGESLFSKGHQLSRKSQLSSSESLRSREDFSPIRIELKSNPYIINNLKAESQSVANSSPVMETSPMIEAKNLSHSPSYGENSFNQSNQRMTPLGGSSSLSEISSARQDLEAQNNFKIIEKLEVSRLEDEKRRTEKLWGSSSSSSAPRVVIVPEEENLSLKSSSPQPPQVSQSSQQSPAVQPSQPSQLSESSSEPLSLSPWSLGLLLGLGDYPSVVNVRNHYSVGFFLDRRVSETFSVEGGFLYSSFDVEQRDGGYLCDPVRGCIHYPRMTRMDQYQGQARIKYSPFTGSFKPYLGGSLAYSYRTFTDIQIELPDNDAHSHSLDGGLVLGVDLNISESLSLGVDFTLFGNILNRASSTGLQQSFSQSAYSSDTPIEELNYVQTGLILKYQF